LVYRKKSYGWIPLEVIQCGEKTSNEKNFYLNFYQEKYEEFKHYKWSVEEFMIGISKNGIF
jgi:hypothetical protein